MLNLFYPSTLIISIAFFDSFKECIHQNLIGEASQFYFFHFISPSNNSDSIHQLPESNLQAHYSNCMESIQSRNNLNTMNNYCCKPIQVP